MSHFGRWEIAARLLPRTAPLTILMESGTESVAADLRRDGVDVVAIPPGEGQAVDILSAIHAVRKGGFVSMAADRASREARKMRATFLGSEVAVNVAPFVLALVTGAPLFVVFAYRVGSRRYRAVCKPALFVRADDRRLRDVALRAAAEAYLEELRLVMREHPEQWHVFGPFLTSDRRPTSARTRAP